MNIKRKNEKECVKGNDEVRECRRDEAREDSKSQSSKGRRRSEKVFQIHRKYKGHCMFFKGIKKKLFKMWNLCCSSEPAT